MAILFHPELDELNQYTTVVSNPETGNVFSINKLGYSILRAIDENPGTNLVTLQQKLKIEFHIDKSPEDVERILNRFIKQKVVLANHG